MDKSKNTNYMLWKFNVETMLKAKELWGLIEKIKTEVKPDEADVIANCNMRKEGEPSVKLARSKPIRQLVDESLKRNHCTWHLGTSGQILHR